MSIGFDCHELDDLTNDMLDLAQNKFPKDTKAFMGRAGNRFRSKAREAYKSETRKHTGNLLKGLNRGRPYIYGSDEYSVRVYNNAPHAHLIEHGHVEWIHLPQMQHAVKTERYVRGRNIMGKQANDFKGEFPDEVEDFVDKLLDEGKL